MEPSFKGRVALVCGASAGIGSGIALGLSRAGADVVLLARGADRLAATAAEIESVTGRKPATVVGDVADPSIADRAVAAAQDTFGRLDILINNASGPPMGSFLAHTNDAWDAAYRTSLWSVVAFTKAAVPGMRERGFGRIVNITSIVGKEPSALMVLSGVFRAGVSAFTKAIASELATTGITINCVGPAAAFTARAERLTRETAEREAISYDEALSRATAALPMKRFATLDEVAAAVLFFASAQASYVTGTTLLVDGATSKGIF
ncbi:3-oxoacyl-[acyl-carrier protein] reductase [Labilithrix luteola]|uniref:3-oxoacyl-[acyl-carrier protein] reductase n=1 Tax=Labilithrix luteola TaxID=1391654 RepID=A0A0K1Q6X5_9BACT|nr:SDR family oxidoreductase [Labilithrix luteola]AKV01155.1 3-oxoacyl-[acyl-carrier protein] reductase [Labilithrix luteola]